MKVIKTQNYETLSKEAAKIFIEIIKKNDKAVLGLATGSTPAGMYKELIEANKNGLDFSKVTTFNLDEYIGLSKDHDQSYDYFMHDNLFNHVNIPEENIHLPKGDGENPEEDAKKYENMLKESGGVDIQVLGIGVNGHIAFNEPAEELKVETNIVNLTESTIEANARFFNSEKDVPTKAITMGMGSIFSAKKILLLISGENKKEAADYILRSGKIKTECPASLLHLHPDVTVIIDKEAFGE